LRYIIEFTRYFTLWQRIQKISAVAFCFQARVEQRNHAFVGFASDKSPDSLL
jgi:hypothetical protein